MNRLIRAAWVAVVTALFCVAVPSVGAGAQAAAPDVGLAQVDEPPAIEPLADEAPTNRTRIVPNGPGLAWLADTIDADEDRIVAASTVSQQLNAYDDPSGVLIFDRRPDGSWLQDTLPGVPRQTDDKFGTSISVDGNKIVVGAWGSDGGTGAAWVFEQDADSGWNYTKLSPIGADVVSFGRDVEVGGDRIVVGADGSVHAFDRVGPGVWQQTVIGHPDPQGGSSDAEFGQLIAMSSSHIVTTRSASDLYVFDAPSGGPIGTQPAVIDVVPPSDQDRGVGLGSSIAIDGTRIAAVRGPGSYEGVYVIDQHSDGAWGLTATLEPARAPRSTNAFRVIIDGENILVGATSLYHRGRIERHAPTGTDGTWTVDVIRPTSLAGEELFAQSFALSGNQLVASSPQSQTLHVHDPCNAQWSGSDLPRCTGTPHGAEDAVAVQHTVSCLAGRGRVDTNIVNTTSFFQSAGGGFRGQLTSARYRIEFQGLSPRESTVKAGDWWRMPVTGRADGDYQVIVRRDGEIISDEVVQVRCAGPHRELEGDVIEVVNGCRGEPGARNGYVLFQFLNATSAERKWIIEFDDGAVRNRSTSAAPWGQSVRAVVGRPDGIYPVNIRVDDTLYDTFDVTVNCDEVPQVEISTRVECDADRRGRVTATAINRSTTTFDLALVVTPGGFTASPADTGAAVELTTSPQPHGTTVDVRAHVDGGGFLPIDQTTVQVDCP